MANSSDRFDGGVGWGLQMESIEWQLRMCVLAAD